MKVGRPSKYTRELLTKAHEYVDGGWQQEDEIPQLVGLAEWCDISEETLHTWRKHKSKKEFSELCARVMGMQKRGLVNKGLRRDIDSSLSKLLLMKHGYSDKQEVDHRSEDGSMSPKDPATTLESLYDLERRKVADEPEP